MRLSNKLEEDTATVDLTPLIDVVFLLLIFFMVSSQFRNIQAIEVNLPKAGSGKSEARDSALEVAINEFGSVYFDGKEIELEQLKEAIKGTTSKRAIINADSESAHGKVIEVLDLFRAEGVIDVALSVKSTSK